MSTSLIDDAFVRRIRRSIATVRSTLSEIFSEIFDEAPYQRYLQRNALPSSRHAYSGFLQEMEAAKARRPRCC